MNRAELMRAMAQERFEPAATVIVMHVGLDAVRSVNDSFGHRVGDRLLAETAARLGRLAPAQGLVARIAGDEFVLVAAADDEDSVEGSGSQLLAALNEPYDLGVFSGVVTASVGVAARRCGDPVGDPGSLLHDADIAMHRVKEAGGRGVAHFDDWMRAELLRTRGLERRLSKALVRDEVVLHYEPIVSLDSRRPVAYEALARWTCDGESMSAAEWIPVAESSGHIIDVGCHLAAAAVLQAKSWQADGAEVALSLNVSARQLRTPDLVRVLDRALEEGLDARRMWLEITERVAVDEVAVRALQHLRDKGFRIALDDFGTGYSSLHAIGRLPIDIVKVDRSFVSGLRQNGNRALVAAVISVADAHRLQVVAEGIETEDQARDLLELGCGWGQGYLFGRATPACRLPRQSNR
jgi:diguanylate cyclase (GGDEF)-like protein